MGEPSHMLWSVPSLLAVLWSLGALEAVAAGLTRAGTRGTKLDVAQCDDVHGLGGPAETPKSNACIHL